MKEIFSLELLKDFVSVIYNSYYKIMRVNLTTDTYEEIRVIDAENFSTIGIPKPKATSISAAFNDLLDAGYIHPDDTSEYTNKTSLSTIRDHFSKNRDKLYSARYRRLVNGEYRWASLEMSPSTLYTPDNQVVVLYVRDINDSYEDILKKQLVLEQ